MDHTTNQALVRTILQHPADLPWRINGIGLLGLRLDDRREYRLHVWDPDGRTDDPPIHDHPYDFRSTIVVGEMVNTRYVEDPSGAEHCRDRYRPGNENERRTDAVRLAGTSTTYGPGDGYSQFAAELHHSDQTPGTVTIIRCECRDRPELTVCRRVGAPWVTGQARPATPGEITRITTAALDLLGDTPSPGTTEHSVAR